MANVCAAMIGSPKRVAVEANGQIAVSGCVALTTVVVEEVVEEVVEVVVVARPH